MDDMRTLLKLTIPAFFVAVAAVEVWSPLRGWRCRQCEVSFQTPLRDGLTTRPRRAPFQMKEYSKYPSRGTPMLGVHQWEVLSLLPRWNLKQKEAHISCCHYPPISPTIPQYPPNTPPITPNTIRPQYPPIHISMPEAWAWAKALGPMGIEGYGRGIRWVLAVLERYWGSHWYVNGTLMVR